MKKDATPAPTTTPGNRDEKPARFLDTREQRRVPLDTRRTEEEARLAAEIEKLRG